MNENKIVSKTIDTSLTDISSSKSDLFHVNLSRFYSH